MDRAEPPAAEEVDCAGVVSRRVYILLLALVVLLSLVPRLWLWYEQGRPGVVYPGDQDEYYRGAIHILLAGSYYDDGQWLRPPLTSIWLAGLFAVLGVDVARALLAQCLLSAATLLLLAELARTLFDSRRAGVGAALLTGVFLPYASQSSQLMSETLFIFLMSAALLLFVAARQRAMSWHWLLAGGMVWGLAALTRPVGLYALPLLLLWAMFHRSRAVAVGPAAALLLGFVVVVAPWTVRNYLVHDHIILVDTNGGTSFWLGNLREPEERELQFVWNRTIPNLAEREQAAMDRALENIRQEPLTFLSRTRNKAVALWQFDIRLFAASAPIGITLDERSLAFAAASDVQYIAVMVLAVLGIAAARPRERSLPLLLWPLYGTLLSAVSLGHPRLRLPLLITFFVFAALPLAHPRQVWARLRASAGGRWRALAGLVVLALLWYARIYEPFAQSQFWLLAARTTGEPAAIERAIAAMPDNYLPYVAQARMLQARGEVLATLAAYEQATARAPNNSYVHLQRFDLYRRFGLDAEAQAAMDAIADVGWNNNTLYDWAWQHMPAASGAQLAMGAPAPGMMRGVYPAEYHAGRAYRWTMGQAQLRFDAPQATMLVLELRAPRSATPVTVSYNGVDVALLRADTDWQTFAVPLPVVDAPLPEGQVVELRSPTTVSSLDEPYARGVALAAAQLVRR